jgi:hypothetical protein
LKTESKQDVLLPYLEKILEFAGRCGQDSIVPARRSDGVVKALVALLGDLGVFVGSYAVPLLSQPFVQQLISECAEDEDTSDIAQYTRDVGLLPHLFSTTSHLSLPPQVITKLQGR